MKKAFLCLVFISATLLNALSQKAANIWQLGHINVSNGKSYYLDFSNDLLDTGVVERNLPFFVTNAGICDTNGELLFYTNGVWIANRNHDTLLNSEDFNPGYGTDFYANSGLGYSQAAIVIPKPGSSNVYDLIYLTTEYVYANGSNFTQPLHLSLSEIDMEGDNGLGEMMLSKKNLLIVEDTIIQGRITACKHANGRDWWIVAHRYHSDLYYKILFSPESIEVIHQNIGGIFNSSDIYGMAVFSPDGSQYAHLNINDTIDLLQFDRCSGEFLDYVKLSVPDTSTLSATLGCSFSPSNRFLYISTYYSLYQFDTWAIDIQQSMIKVGAWEDQTGWPDWFFLHQLAPDGKIYISIFNSDHWMHVINNPDSLGLACDFVQAGLTLPYVASNSSIPNFPNYDLGPLPGSPCDTLYLGSNVQNEDVHSFRISPNPASDFFNIVYKTDHEIIATITNEIGHELQRFTLYPWFKNRIVYTDKLAPGIYLLTFTGKDLRESKKLIIQH